MAALIEPVLYDPRPAKSIRATQFYFTFASARLRRVAPDP